jgi:hypothetical protein
VAKTGAILNFTMPESSYSRRSSANVRSKSGPSDSVSGVQEKEALVLGDGIPSVGLL